VSTCDGERFGAAGEVPVQSLGDLAALRAVGQDPVVDASWREVKKGCAQRQQRRDDDHDVGDRSAHHGPCDARPCPVGVGRGFGVAAGAARKEGNAQRVDPGSEGREQRGQDGEGPHHRHQYRGDAAEPHRPEEHLREEQQRRQRDGHRQAGDCHRPAGSAHGAYQCSLDSAAISGSSADGAELLAEAAHDEQGVVDREAQPQHRDDVDGED
jgi:hypothetical protein